MEQYIKQNRAIAQLTSREGVGGATHRFAYSSPLGRLGGVLILFLLSLSLSLSAQKNVRKAVRDGNKAYKDQLYGNAEEKYKKAQAENQASKEASFNLANTYYKQQRWEDALKEYNHYTLLETHNRIKAGKAWANAGNTYLKMKANEKGQQVQQPPQGGDEQQQQKPDNLQLSMEAYKMALRNNPNDDEVRYNLAVVQKMIQDQKSDGGKDNKDKKDKKDQDKKDQDKKDKEQDKKDENKDQNQKKDNNQQQQQDKGGMSQQNMQQILNAIEQDERETQQRVKEIQAQERQKKNQQNKRQNKDW